MAKREGAANKKNPKKTFKKKRRFPIHYGEERGLLSARVRSTFQEKNIPYCGNYASKVEIRL